MPIQQLLVDETMNFIDGYIRGAVVTLNDKEVDYPIHTTLREGNRLKKFVYLQSETGKVIDAKLVDAQGRDLQSQSVNITKGEDGYMIVFSIDLIVKEAGK